MSTEVQPIREWSNVTRDLFAAEIRPLRQPAVLRGLKSDWPLVKAGLQSSKAAVDYLLKFYKDQPVSMISVPPEEKGRIFYNKAMNGYNFGRSNANMREVLRGLLKFEGEAAVPAVALQAVEAPYILPGFDDEQPMEVVPGIASKLWISNAAHVAPHYDLQENIACVAVGRRRFTLFPPEQLPNLYVGPMENTPGGAPVSLVALADPDLETYPRFAQALSAAQSAELEPGDAVYIPYMWWHGVQSLAPFNVLVNYWWNDHPARSQIHPSTAMALAWITFMDMPAEHKERWRAMFDHYVFSEGKAMEHLPEHARGVLGELSDQQIARVKQMLAQAIVERL